LLSHNLLEEVYSAESKSLTRCRSVNPRLSTTCVQPFAKHNSTHKPDELSDSICMTQLNQHASSLTKDNIRRKEAQK